MALTSSGPSSRTAPGLASVDAATNDATRTTEELDAETTEEMGPEITEELDAENTEDLDGETTEALDGETTEDLDAETASETPTTAIIKLSSPQFYGKCSPMLLPDTPLPAGCSAWPTHVFPAPFNRTPDEENNLEILVSEGFRAVTLLSFPSMSLPVLGRMAQQFFDTQGGLEQVGKTRKIATITISGMSGEVLYYVLSLAHPWLNEPDYSSLPDELIIDILQGLRTLGATDLIWLLRHSIIDFAVERSIFFPLTCAAHVRTVSHAISTLPLSADRDAIYAKIPPQEYAAKVAQFDELRAMALATAGSLLVPRASFNTQEHISLMWLPEEKAVLLSPFRCYHGFLASVDLQDGDQVGVASNFVPFVRKLHEYVSTAPSITLEVIRRFTWDYVLKKDSPLCKEDPCGKTMSRDVQEFVELYFEAAKIEVAKTFCKTADDPSSRYGEIDGLFRMSTF